MMILLLITIYGFPTELKISRLFLTPARGHPNSLGRGLGSTEGGSCFTHSGLNLEEQTHITLPKLTGSTSAFQCFEAKTHKTFSKLESRMCAERQWRSFLPYPKSLTVEQGNELSQLPS